MHLLNVGTKGVARAMSKIVQGPAYKEGITWFQQLSDKCILCGSHYFYNVCGFLLYVDMAIYLYLCCRKQHKDAPVLGNEELRWYG